MHGYQGDNFSGVSCRPLLDVCYNTVMSKAWLSRVSSACTVLYILFVFWICLSTRVHAAQDGHAQAATPNGTQGGGTAPGKEGEDAPGYALQSRLAQQTAKLESDRQAFEVQQQYLKGRTDDLEHLISEMTIGSSIYTLLLGLFAFFGLKAAQDQATRQLADWAKQANGDKTARDKDFAELREKIQGDIPSMIAIEETLQRLLVRIRREVDRSKDWTSPIAYREMPEVQRQAVLLHEITILSLAPFGLESFQHFEAAAKILANIANFYSARARRDPVFDQSDMARALLHIRRACEINPRDAGLFSLRAAFTLKNVRGDSDKPTENQMDAAEVDLRRCLELNAKDVVGLYSLAWIADEREDPQQAADLLTRIVEQRGSLPEHVRKNRMSGTFINRACARVKASRTLLELPEASPEKQRLIEAVLSDCREAGVEANLDNNVKGWQASLQREFGRGGELFLIAQLVGSERLASLGENAN